MLQSLIRKRLFVALLFGVSLLLLLLIGVISYRNTQTWVDNRNEVIAVRENILNYEKLLSALKDAEIGQRGYILTRDSSYLEPYLMAADSIRTITTRLQIYPGRDVLTQQTEERINNLIRRRQAILAVSLANFETLKRTSPATASQQLPFGRGKVLMDSLRLEIKQLQAYKSQLLRLKMQELSGRSDTIMRAQVGGTVAGMLLLIWAFVLLRQEMKKRRQSLLALEESNNLLELRVQERTNELYAALEELNTSNEELQASNEQQAALLEQLDVVGQRLNLALKISRMGAWMWHLHSNQIEWDENLEAVYGLVPGEFERTYGSNFEGFKRLIHPEDLPVLLETVNESLRTHSPFQAEYRIVRPDGAVHWLLGQGTVINNEQNQPVSMTGIDMDITERKLAGEKIRESEERFRTMADTAPVLIWMSGTDALCFYFNKPWLDFTGRTAAQEWGNGWVEGVHPDDQQRCLHIYQSAFSAQKPFQMEYRLRRHDGMYRWITDHGVPRFTPDGTFEGYIGSGMDIHNRVEAEAKLRRLFDSGMLGVLEWSFQSGITAANDTFLKMIGYSREEMENAQINWADLTPAEYRSRDELVSAQLRETGVGVPYEKELIRKDGTRIFVMIGAALLAGQADAGIAFVLNTTTQQAALKQLRESEERFRVAIENSPILVFNCDADLHYTWVYNNAAAGNLQDNWLIGKTDLEIMEVPQEAERMMALKRQVIQTGVGKKEEVGITISGQRHVHILTMEPLRNEFGEVVGLTCATFDITERKEAEERLRRSEAKLRRLFESGLIGIIYYDFGGLIREANDVFLSMTGYTQEDVTAGLLNWIAMTPPDYTHKDKKYLQQLQEQGTFEVFEKEFYRKDGTSAPVLLGGATLEGHDNQGVAFVLDISERKEAEERVKKSERLLYEVFENSADALFLINTQGNIVERYNQQAVLLFGLEDTQKYVGLEAQNLQKHPFTEEESEQVMEQLTTKGFWSAELEYVTMQGRDFWGNAAVSLINVNDQQYYLIRIRDITDRKYFEERLQKSQRVLESIFEGVADALFVVDPANNLIVDCNQQVAKMFEFSSKEEVIGRNGNALQKKPFTEEEIKRIGHEIWAKRYWSSEVEYVTQMGRPFWGDIAITIIPFEDKEHLLVRVGDITDRKRYQEILHQNQQELLRQKQRTEAALAIIAEDNERKTQELEEAQALQLSMLPQELPSIPYLDVAMVMKTSVEVGGDYYDYKLHENGDITLVIGDATGHGLKAGIVVATVKSYFQTLAGQYEAIELLERISEGIQNLQIRGMYMGLTVMHFSNNRVVVASSGMPPLYLFRQATGKVETILFKGIFLGSRLDVPIEQTTLTLSPGDTILAMSDGLPELFNAKREMLDYKNIELAFKTSAYQPGQQIIDHLMELGHQWNGGASNEDDITLLVIKAK